MAKTYEIIPQIASFNQSITHFCLRLYKSVTGLAATPDDEFQYEWIKVESAANIAQLISDYESKGWVISLTSMVMTTEGIQHLLMLDYLVDHSRSAENDITLKLSEFNQSGDVPYKLDGYLIQTNNSYHYLGKYITTESNLINFLGSALLFRHSERGETYIVDDIWLGRSIKRRFCAIRLSQKEGLFPEVIREVK